ncbi:MAG: ABC transporter substrate-binding protein [Caldilineaceae bacterium]
MRPIRLLKRPWLLVGLLLLLLTACAPSEPAVEESAPEPAAAATAAESADDAEASDVVEIAVTPTPETARSGKIVISFQGRDTQTWEAMCDAYTERNPDVECVVELKPSEGYQEWIRTQFARCARSPFVNANVVADLVNDKRFLDLAAYLDQTSPYTNQPWREDMDDAALANMRNPVTGATYMLNLETVQVLWFYNKSAFADAGILEDAEALAQTPRNQPTWDQFMGWCDALNEAGYIPVSIAGDYDSFWSGAFGWLARMYADQFTRHEAEPCAARKGTTVSARASTIVELRPHRPLQRRRHRYHV